MIKVTSDASLRSFDLVRRANRGEGEWVVETVEIHSRLADITTQWTLVFEAASSKPEIVSAATAKLMCRYSGAVHRYLLKALNDPDAAADLDQEFAVRFLRGDFRHGDPERGRFRDYVKRSLQNLMKDYHRRAVVRRTVALSKVEEPVDDRRTNEHFEQEFLDSWRTDLLDRAWKSLEEMERKGGQPYYTVLRYRVDHQDLNSTESAEALSTILGRRITAGNFRQTLLRSRQRYVQFLIDDVTTSLRGDTGVTELEEELSDLRLLDHCRPYMKAMEREKATRAG
jgi:RNA polymerase sigma factor (sigma-70 family)